MNILPSNMNGAQEIVRKLNFLNNFYNMKCFAIVFYKTTAVRRDFKLPLTYAKILFEIGDNCVKNSQLNKTYALLKEVYGPRLKTCLKHNGRK